MGSLQGRRAIVTGAASGIGRATALLLAREGASVVVADLDAAGAETVATTIGESGGRAISVACDVAVEEQVRAAVDAALRAFGGVDILVNNAGIIRRTTVVDIDADEWDRVMAVNVRSVFLFSKHVVPLMAAAGGGSIVNTGSGWGLKGGSRAASYCASKAAVVNLTRAMAIDHAGQGIRVNCICPGDTDTGMLRDEARQLGEAEPAFLAESAARPLARIARPEEIASAVLFLASDASSFVTGTALVVDGGGLA